jgi:hypothetical protein
MLEPKMYNGNMRENASDQPLTIIFPRKVWRLPGPFSGAARWTERFILVK